MKIQPITTTITPYGSTFRDNIIALTADNSVECDMIVGNKILSDVEGVIREGWSFFDPDTRDISHRTLNVLGKSFMPFRIYVADAWRLSIPIYSWYNNVGDEDVYISFTRKDRERWTRKHLEQSVIIDINNKPATIFKRGGDRKYATSQTHNI